MDIPNPMRLKLFTYYLSVSFISASLGYAFFSFILGDHVFGALYRMFLYHDAHPFQYIAIVCIVFASVASLLTPSFTHLKTWRRFLAIVGLMLGSIIIASIPGGILWSLHDMQAGYFPTGARFWNALAWGATTGLRIGWLIILLSIPYNIVGLVIGYLITDQGFRRSPRAGPSSP